MFERALAVNEVIVMYDRNTSTAVGWRWRAEHVVGNRVSGPGKNLYGTMLQLARLPVNLNKTEPLGLDSHTPFPSHLILTVSSATTSP